MAQLMYVAALSFYKILVVSEGISIAEICMYRFGTLFAIQTVKWTCCNYMNCDGSRESQYERDSSPRYEEEQEQEEIPEERANILLVTLIYVT